MNNITIENTYRLISSVEEIENIKNIIKGDISSPLIMERYVNQNTFEPMALVIYEAKDTSLNVSNYLRYAIHINVFPDEWIIKE